MFNSLSGEVTLREDDRLCVATGGVEWELAVSRKAAARFPAPGQPVLQVRRTAIGLGGRPVEYRVSTIVTTAHDYVNLLSRPS